MGTRSVVAIETAGKIKSTYVHWDGYVTGVGGTILRHYNDRKGAQAIAKLGYASSLCATIAETTENTVEHNRDEKPVKCQDRAEYLEYANNTWAEYAYLFADGRWFVAEIDGTGEEIWQVLELAHANDMAGAE